MAIMNFMKSTIGAGVLFLPYALAQSGMIPGLGLILLGAGMLTYSLHLVCRVSVSNPTDFVTIARGLWGFKGELVTALFQFAFLLTPLTAYIKLVGGFAYGAIQYFAQAGDEPVVAQSLISIICATVFIVPLSLLNNLSRLSFVSVLGMLCVAYIVGLVVIDYLVDQARGELQQPVLEWFVWDLSLLSAFSAIILSYVNQPSILPIISSLERPTEARKKTLIMSTQVAVLLVYLTVAFCGYLHFGAVIKTYGAILNGKPDSVAYVVGGLLTSVLLIFTYPLILFPARLTLDWLFLTILGRFGPRFRAKLQGTYGLFVAEGLAIILLTTFLALVFPQVTDILDVFVPIGGSFIAFIFPSVAFLKLRKSVAATSFESFMAVACFLLGIIVTFVGTPVAICNLISKM